MCSTSPPPADEEYRHAEMLDDAEACSYMNTWNSVIHASLKRKLQGLIAESPVASGVSALLHTAPGHSAGVSPRPGSPDTLESSPPSGLTPEQVVSYLLAAFQRDALAGAAAFVSLASRNCRVRLTTPQTLVLFIGDNDSYRPLLHVQSFYCATPRFEAGGAKCVVSAEVRGTDSEKFKFDFQLSCDDSGAWLIDELFRL